MTKISESSASNAPWTPVTRPFLPPREMLDKYIDGIYRRNHLTNYGPLVQSLEQRLAQRLGVAEVVLVANGTLAIQLALRSLGKQGSVLTTPFTFPATATSIVWEGMSPRFCDIDPDTFNLSPRCVREQADASTVAILGVHVYGGACDVDSIAAIAAESGLSVIYDASHCFDISLRGRSLLSFGDISTLSFHATKLFHTIEGGAVIVSDPAKAEHIRRMVQFGIGSDGSCSVIGTNAKLSEFHAAMGHAVLDCMDTIHAGRQRVVQRYREQLDGVSVQYPTLHPEQNYNNAYFPVFLPGSAELEKFLAKCQGQNIFPRRYFWPSVNRQPAFEKYYSPCPVAENAAERVACLPVWPDLDDATIDRICGILKRHVRH